MEGTPTTPTTQPPLPPTPEPVQSKGIKSDIMLFVGILIFVIIVAGILVFYFQSKSKSVEKAMQANDTTVSAELSPTVEPTKSAEEAEVDTINIDASTSSDFSTVEKDLQGL